MSRIRKLARLPKISINGIRHCRRNFPYVYKWTEDIEHLLPQHYKDRCREFMLKEPTPVHWRPNPNLYEVRESTAERFPVQNVPVDVKFPRQCNKGLWGGEGFVWGYTEKKPRSKSKYAEPRRWPHIWQPYLSRRILYSEILDKYFNIVVTLRALDLIDENFGFDFYILKTHEVDLCSKLGMDLKREMLVTLAKESCYPDNPEKRQEILNRYKDFVIPLEEAEWVGLSVEEALEKVRQQEKDNPPPPLKDLFMRELVQELSEVSVSEEESTSQWIRSKLNPFKSKEEMEQKQ